MEVDCPSWDAVPELAPVTAAAASTSSSCCPTVLAAVSSTLRSLSYLLIPTSIIGAGGHVPGTDVGGGGGGPMCRQSV